jgi:predicted outer membrane protein
MRSTYLKGALALAVACGDGAGGDADDNGAARVGFSATEALGLVIAADEALIEHGQLGVTYLDAPVARSFAETVVDEHTHAQSQLEAEAARLSLSAEATAESRKLEAFGSALVTELQELQATLQPLGFDEAYLERQLILRRRVLDDVDLHVVPVLDGTVAEDVGAEVRAALVDELAEACGILNGLRDRDAGAPCE